MGSLQQSFTARYIREDGTALHWAAHYGQQDIAKLLIDNGASMLLNAQGSQVGIAGKTVFHRSVQIHAISSVSLLRMVILLITCIHKTSLIN